MTKDKPEAAGEAGDAFYVRQAWHRVEEAMKFYALVALFMRSPRGGSMRHTEVGYLARNCMPDITTVEQALKALPTPSPAKPVSLERCAIACSLADSTGQPIPEEYESMAEYYRVLAKAVLDAANVPYCDQQTEG